MPHHHSMEPLFSNFSFWFRRLFHIPLAAVKSRIECVEVLGVEVILHDSQGFAKTGGLK